MNQNSFHKQAKASTMQVNIVSTDLDLSIQAGLTTSDKNAIGHRSQPSIDKYLSQQHIRSLASNTNPQEAKKSIFFHHLDNHKETDIQNHEIH